MGLMGTYKWAVYDTADLRTRDWPFLGDFMPILLILAIYLYIVKIGGPQFMKDRKPYNLKRIIQVYNVMQIISCTLIIVAIYNHITVKDLLSTKMPDTSQEYHALQQTKICWWLLCLKIVELVETVFFVLRRKFNQASLLHLHHHVATVIMAWVCANYYPGGSTLFPIQLNTFIHFVMYTYYLLSTFGPKWQKVLGQWKSKLTMLQMIQFCIILLHASQVFLSAQWATIPIACHLVFWPNVLFIFKNFYDFYQVSYNKKTT